ncbi:hypothetical protein LguiB_018949 [Lonicera macranthoides]
MDFSYKKLSRGPCRRSTGCSFYIASSSFGVQGRQEILSYINTTKNPTASFKFYNLTIMGKDRAPIVAAISSRGPSLIAPKILKPDLIAPGAAALLRAAYPDWTSAAIRSARMTTAQIFDNQYRPTARYEDMEPATVPGIGAGHINPQLAANPGLIYDAYISDYANFLCSLNYTVEQMKPYADRSNPCSGHPGSPADLNYPSFSVVFKPHI